MKYKFLLLCVLFFYQKVLAQNTRLNHSNSIGWYNYFGTFKLSNKLGLHTEYQWRRDHLILNWQQSLLRIGINYNLTPRIMFRVGYAWVETFPYGEYSLNSFGKDFTEHRLFEMTQLNHREGRVDFTHRFMLEQRFVDTYSSVNEFKEDKFSLLNRARYMVKLQMPFINKEIKYQSPYLAVYDELFIGFGENVNMNIFDQNRLGILIGYQFNKLFKIEAGYLNQILQFGRQISGRNVFQYNSGLILNVNVNIDLSKAKQN